MKIELLDIIETNLAYGERVRSIRYNRRSPTPGQVNRGVIPPREKYACAMGEPPTSFCRQC